MTTTIALRRAAALSALVVLGGCAQQRTPATGTGLALDASVTRGLEQLRAATRPFHNLDTAVAAGYSRDVTECLVHESHGGMGYHHVNRSYLEAKPVVTRPQILLYERLADGKYRLNGAEFIVPYRLWSRDSAPPTILGQHLRREDNLSLWYLHVWAWTQNTAGVFANFNSAVKCRTGKPYEPFTRPGE